MFGTLGTTEILLIVGLVILLFGAGSIPKLARSFGRAQGEFKRARKQVEDEVHKGEDESERTRKEEEERKRTESAAAGLRSTQGP